MTSLLRQHKAIAADPSYDDNAANAMYLWCINTGELYPKFLELVNVFSEDMDSLTGAIYGMCLAQRQSLAKAESELGRVSHASCMGAAIAIADYYLNVHR
jgi:hypothetical protein